MILTADWHLDDNPMNIYRWKVFDHLVQFAKETNDYDIYILGDLGDRKDRHSAKFVNDIIENFRMLLKYGMRITIILGNHDAPLKGPPYWQFLSFIHKNLKFLVKPAFQDGILLLPFSENPDADWKEVLEYDYNAIFMHQPVDGVRMENGSMYHAEHGLPLPTDCVVWSGDIHTPQKVGNVNYVGAPHPIKFGDDYTCRMLRLDSKFRVSQVYDPSPIRKWMLELDSIDKLDQYTLNAHDQVKIRYFVDPDKIAAWPLEREILAGWVKDARAVLVSIEPKIVLGKRTKKAKTTLETDPLAVLKEYAANEGLSEKILEIGQQMLEKVLRR